MTHSIASNGSLENDESHTPHFMPHRPEGSILSGGKGTGSILSNDDAGTSVASATAQQLGDGSTIWSTIEESLTSFFLNLTEKTKINATNWYGFIYHIILHIYVMWTMLYLPAISSKDYQWKEQSSWVWKAMNYPVTLSLSLVPYEGIIAIFSVFIAIIASYYILLALAFKASSVVNKNWKKIKAATRIVQGMITLFSLVFSYVFSSFLDCDYGTLVSIPDAERPVEVLLRYPQVACTSTGNSVLISFGCVFFLLMLGVLVVSVPTLAEDNPSSRNIFTTDFTFYMLPVIASQCIYIVLMAILPSTYPFVKPLLYLVISLLHVPYHVWFLPFFRKIENTVFFGFLFARVGTATGFLISSLVTTEADLGMMGLTFGLGFVFFIVGAAGLDIYITVMYVGIRRAILKSLKSSVESTQIITYRTMIEREATLLYQRFEKEGRLKGLELFLKFSMKSGYSRSSTELNLSDVEIALSIIRGSANQKCVNNVNILIVASVAVAYFLPNFTSVILAGGIIKKVSKLKGNIYKRYHIAQRTKEIEFLSGEDLSGKNIMEIKNILSKLERKQEYVFLLHKGMFFESCNLQG